MSRRPGQNGRLEKRGGSFSFLFYRDVPGSAKRQRVCRTLKATTMVAAKQEAQRILDGEGVNTAVHLEASRGPVVTFGVAAELWRSQQLLANGKHSSKRTMGCELDKHVLPLLKDTPIQEITYPVIRALVQAWKREELGNKSMRNYSASCGRSTPSTLMRHCSTEKQLRCRGLSNGARWNPQAPWKWTRRATRQIKWRQ